ncbi:MAG: phosphonate metabolism transcriptional regulator PhnF [Acidiphilium sp.]|nr:phosphonate metabolism transcriptional regulator PhnF [Acidiphilium sp.]MDD4936465.1 phosphonate metabolism transcriptional regulator PhnF [Acidiphilium sp.]
MMRRGNGVTVWSQIAAQLRIEIDSGRTPPGTKLPPEADLAQHFGVNRHTVRRALEELARNRLIRIEHGRGSFVAEPVLDYQINRRPRFSEWVRRHNREPLGEVLSLREIDLAELAEADIIADALSLPSGEAVIELERLGKADDRPIALSRHIFPARRHPGLLKALAAHKTITAALYSIGITDYVRLRSRISARMPTPREAGLLALEAGAPVLQSENLNITEAEIPLELCFVIYPATRVALIVEPSGSSDLDSDHRMVG